MLSFVDRVVVEEVEVTEKEVWVAVVGKTVQMVRGNRETRTIACPVHRLRLDQAVNQRKTLWAQSEGLRASWKTTPRVRTRETADAEEDVITSRKTTPPIPGNRKTTRVGSKAGRMTMTTTLVDLAEAAADVVVVDRDNAVEADSAEDVGNKLRPSASSPATVPLYAYVADDFESILTYSFICCEAGSQSNVFRIFLTCRQLGQTAGLFALYNSKTMLKSLF